MNEKKQKNKFNEKVQKTTVLQLTCEYQHNQSLICG